MYILAVTLPCVDFMGFYHGGCIPGHMWSGRALHWTFSLKITEGQLLTIYSSGRSVHAVYGPLTGHGMFLAPGSPELCVRGNKY